MSECLSVSGLAVFVCVCGVCVCVSQSTDAHMRCISFMR